MQTEPKGAPARAIMDSPIKATALRAGFDLYQERAVSFAKYKPIMRTWYPALKLNGEAGEVAEKVGKAFRDNDGIFDMQRRQDIAKEIGDVLWYCAAVARDLGLSLGDCAIGNFTKLIDRADRDVLGGSGDNR